MWLSCFRELSFGERQYRTILQITLELVAEHFIKISRRTRFSPLFESTFVDVLKGGIANYFVLLKDDFFILCVRRNYNADT